MENLKKCKYCQSDIPKKAKVCPNCRRTLKSHGCLVSIFTVIIIFGGIMAMIIGTVGQNKAIQKGVSGVSDESEYITMEEFNQIENGMSYDDVKEIIGSEGELSTSSSTENYTISIYTWYGNGVAGSNANFTFSNDKLSAKAQVGLQ